MPIVPLLGTATRGKSPTISAQRRINVVAERYAGDAVDKAPFNLLGRFGLTNLGTINRVLPPNNFAIVRGFSEQNPMWTNPGSGTQADTLQRGAFFVAGPDIGVVGRGIYPLIWQSNALASQQGPVSIAMNPIQMLIADGASGYIVNLAYPFTVTPLAGTGTAFPMGTNSVCFIAGRFVAVDPYHPGRFYWSHVNDGLTWDALDFATAESAPDPLMSVKENAGELVLLGRDTTEFWGPSGDTAIFRRLGGAGIDWGCVAPFSVQKAIGGLVLLGRQRIGGDAQVIFLASHQATEISDPDVVSDINAEEDLNQAVALAYVAGGHAFYQLNLSTTSWVFDFTAKMWSEFRSAGARHYAQHATVCDNQTILSDYSSADVYTPDFASQIDDHITMVAPFSPPVAVELISKHALADYERFAVSELYVDLEVGDNPSGVAADFDPQVMLQWSKDGGRTFGNEVWRSLGKVGEYRTRATWRNLGIARDWVFRLRVTDPVRRVITNAAMRI
jgi:hypothetical protein